MSILAKSAILKAIADNEITITPFNKEFVNPNGVEVTLGKNLIVYKNFPLDVRKDNEYEIIEIPESGLLLEPNKLYLGVTRECTHTPYHVPVMEGKSSRARLGISAHHCAGFGDIGFNGHWTVELTVVHPTIVYEGMKIGQVAFYEVVGSCDMDYSEVGRYNNNYSENPLPILPKKDVV